MEKLLMLGTSNLSVEIVKLAKSQGIYTVTTDYLAPERSAGQHDDQRLRCRWCLFL